MLLLTAAAGAQLLHEATTRWLEVRRQENLRGNVPAMSTASLAAMRRDIAASCLLASGVTRIFGVMPGTIWALTTMQASVFNNNALETFA